MCWEAPDPWWLSQEEDSDEFDLDDFDDDDYSNKFMEERMAQVLYAAQMFRL